MDSTHPWVSDFQMDTDHRTTKSSNSSPEEPGRRLCPVLSGSCCLHKLVTLVWSFKSFSGVVLPTLSPRLQVSFKAHFPFPFLLVLWHSPWVPHEGRATCFGVLSMLWYDTCQTVKAECPLQIAELVAQGKCHALEDCVQGSVGQRVMWGGLATVLARNAH